jgi:hypothetical protein
MIPSLGTIGLSGPVSFHVRDIALPVKRRDGPSRPHRCADAIRLNLSPPDDAARHLTMPR